MYKFWIKTTDGQEIVWLRLTEQQAIRLNNQTDKNINWTNIKSFGWEEMK
jgi:hypothetical protein